MSFAVPHLLEPQRIEMRVPASKSRVQRRMVLERLAGQVPRLPDDTFAPPGADVLRLHAALRQLGPFSKGALGTGRESLRLDLGEGATGLRFAMALAALRPTGARTLVTGRPGLLRRPHRGLARALARAGVRLVRRQSGAYRIHGGGLIPGRWQVAGAPSSQYASALALVLPALGGGELERMGPLVSDDYFRLTLAMLAEAGATIVQGPGVPGPGERAGAARIRISGPAGRAACLRDAADASAAATWFTAAALTGSTVHVPQLERDDGQADLALLDILECLGCAVRSERGGVTVTGARGEHVGVSGLGEVDLRDAPDLLPMVAVLAACGPGTTLVRGIAHARSKESDRPARLAQLLEQVGIAARLTEADELEITGGEPRGAEVVVGDDHRLAFAMGVLGLRTGGMRLLGASSASKSHPAFLADLETFASGAPLSGA